MHELFKSDHQTSLGILQENQGLFCIVAGDGALIESSPTYPLGFLLLCGVCTPNHLFFGLII